MKCVIPRQQEGQRKLRNFRASQLQDNLGNKTERGDFATVGVPQSNLQGRADTMPITFVGDRAVCGVRHNVMLLRGAFSSLELFLLLRYTTFIRYILLTDGEIRARFARGERKIDLPRRHLERVRQAAGPVQSQRGGGGVQLVRRREALNVRLQLNSQAEQRPRHRRRQTTACLRGSMKNVLRCTSPVQGRESSANCVKREQTCACPVLQAGEGK